MGALGDGCSGGETACNGMGHVFTVGLEEEEEMVGGYGPVPRSTAGIEDAVKVLLLGLGEDPDRDGLKRTPHRVAKAFRDGTRDVCIHLLVCVGDYPSALFHTMLPLPSISRNVLQQSIQQLQLPFFPFNAVKFGYKQSVHDIVEGALFPEAGSNIGMGQAGGTGGLVVVRDITLFSFCESCLLPFKVECHVGYVPSGQRVVGLSKLARVADVFAKRLQDPQRLANDICSALQNSVKPAGVAVFLQCSHIQIPEVVKSVQRHSSKSDMQGWVQVPAFSCTGAFEDEKSTLWFEYLSLLKFSGVTVVKNQTKLSAAQHLWCPLKSQDMPLCSEYITSPKNGSISSKLGATQAAMLVAVTSILALLGEDPQRRELVGTPYRFVQWLMNFKRSTFDLKINEINNGRTDFYKKIDVVHDQSNIHSELNLPFCSQCEHHLLPFQGVVHIGYLSSQETKAVERSTLQSIVLFFGSKLQVQERLTRQIADTVFSTVHGGVMVVVEANHICMISRGIEKVGSSTGTIAVLGQFATNVDAREKFLQAIPNSTISGC